MLKEEFELRVVIKKFLEKTEKNARKKCGYFNEVG